MHLGCAVGLPLSTVDTSWVCRGGSSVNGRYTLGVPWLDCSCSGILGICILEVSEPL